jgi:glyoxylase-like metal-dependent hydrolase (beta-lactamase superfamily II)
MGSQYDPTKPAVMTPDDLVLIDLDQNLPGQREFISSWLYQSADLTYLVDPGPPATIARLLARLRDENISRLDYVLLTHVHLDHAGGTAQILAAYPDARVACHPGGVTHLVDPGHLWEGSRKVLGAMALAYGEPAAVSAAALATLDELGERGIAAIETPGHAAHHLSFLHAGTLFCGEAAGTYKALGNGQFYLRPATPPRFFLEPALASLDRLLAMTPAPARLAFAHHGLAAGNSEVILATARAQLLNWVRLASQESASGAATLADLQARIIARLGDEDPHFGLVNQLAPDIQQRELQFATNSLAGILGYLDQRD